MTKTVMASGADAMDTAPLAHVGEGPGSPQVSPVVLASRQDRSNGDRPIPMRRVVAPIAIAAVLIAASVGVGGALVSRRIAENQAVHDVAELTDAYATSVIQPALTDAIATDSAVARRVLDPIVRGNLIGGSLIRVKLWAPDGTIRYSDESQLIGERFALDPDAVSALTDPRTSADVSDLRRPENRFERSMGKLLEVYRPVWTPNGQPLLFETYFRYDTVSSRSHQLWRGFSGVMLSSLAALLILLIPLGAVLLTRARRARAQREMLMRRALDASDDERRRIAASLHDGVVQQLAALSFSASGQAETSAALGDARGAQRFEALAAGMREGIGGLRSLLVDIYPPNLHTQGLSVALEDLARGASGDAVLTTEVDAGVADGLPDAEQEAAFRVAQEALRNASRHSGARRLRLRLQAIDDERAVLEVADDGHGFDVPPPSGEVEPGHFGLQLMAEAARRCGAQLTLLTAPGAGTVVSMELQRR